MKNLSKKHLAENGGFLYANSIVKISCGRLSTYQVHQTKGKTFVHLFVYYLDFS